MVKKAATALTKKRKSSISGATHDSVNPPNLIDFMLQEWKAPKAGKVPRVDGWQHFKARRDALSKAFPGETLVIPTGHEKVRANDTHYRFRPGSDFYYLTGNVEPDGVLVLRPKAGGKHESLLFVEPNPGKTDPIFFTDRNKGELWVGPRLGVPESKARYGVDQAMPLGELPEILKGLRRPATRPHRVLRGFSAKVEADVGPENDRDKAFATLLSEMRLCKDSHEVRALQRACDSTARGFDDVIWRLRHAESEREVEGIFGLRARMEGHDVGYGTIAASGAHACVLHWTQNNGAVKDGDLLLLDAGVEGHEMYTADITRTLPVSGKFSPAQREIYDLVRDAQEQAFAAVRPGNDFLEPNRVAMRVLAYGLERLGILPMSAEEALADENQFYKRYTLHNVSHMLGIDVHDCAKARQEAYKYGKLVAGMVLTVEPGLYFQLDDLTVPQKYRGIGVRIEDDLLVTDKGYRILSELPRDSDDVEAWMARVWKDKNRP